MSELPGGLTNRNYKVTTPDGSFVARVWSRGDLLAINRDHEYHNSVAAAQAGVGAPVVAYHPGDSLLVLGYIDGRTYGNADVQPATSAASPWPATGCTTGRGSAVSSTSSPTSAGTGRWPASTDSPSRLGYDDLVPRVEDARKALAVRETGTVPCNNDLLAANFIDDGGQIWIIDYEYSGNNDPCFELGNIWGECGMSLDALAELVTSYHGKVLRNKIARARLLGVAARYGWTLWGAIQHATSPLDFDFWAWGMERYEWAAQRLTSRDFARLLEDVQRED